MMLYVFIRDLLVIITFNYSAGILILQKQKKKKKEKKNPYFQSSPENVLMQAKRSGHGCSKLTTSLVNETLKFQMLISQICQYFLLKQCEKLLHCKSFSIFFS